jgi:hypothetical protein
MPHLKVTITLPLVERGNWDIFHDGVESVKNSVRLNDLIDVTLDGKMLSQQFVGRFGCGTITLEKAGE